MRAGGKPLSHRSRTRATAMRVFMMIPGYPSLVLGPRTTLPSTSFSVADTYTPFSSAHPGLFER